MRRYKKKQLWISGEVVSIVLRVIYWMIAYLYSNFLVNLKIRSLDTHKWNETENGFYFDFKKYVCFEYRKHFNWIGLHYSQTEQIHVWIQNNWGMLLSIKWIFDDF